MGQPAAAAREPSFAGLLASALAPPDSGKAVPADAWADDGLEDDIAAISRDGVVRSRAGSEPAAPGRASGPQPLSGPAAGAGRKPPLPERDPDWKKPRTTSRQEQLTIVEAADTRPASTAKVLMRSSITIRMSHAECAQLRARAAESGLTVSAYLRSCTLEVEQLRAQVKKVLAQMRAASSSVATSVAPAASQKAPPVEKPSLYGRLSQLWPKRPAAADKVLA